MIFAIEYQIGSIQFVLEYIFDVDDDPVVEGCRSGDDEDIWLLRHFFIIESDIDLKHILIEIQIFLLPGGDGNIVGINAFHLQDKNRIQENPANSSTPDNTNLNPLDIDIKYLLIHTDINRISFLQSIYDELLVMFQCM